MQCANAIVDYGFGPGRCGEGPGRNLGLCGRRNPTADVCVASSMDRGLTRIRAGTSTRAQLPVVDGPPVVVAVDGDGVARVQL